MLILRKPEEIEKIRVSNIMVAQILEALGGLPPDHEHCALLAANTLHQALRSYAVKGTGL